jgi:hypothetical protein
MASRKGAKAELEMEKYVAEWHCGKHAKATLRLRAFA